MLKKLGETIDFRKLPLITGCLAIAFGSNTAIAQITPDQTLGSESSFVTPNIDIQNLTADRIDGGAIRGSNIFHSFQEFNVTEGQRVYFNNPPGIQNIIGRVTGNNPSNILGTLGVSGNANLFLINPNGLIFGQNARLDVAGSFLASTANSVNFADGTRFSTTASATTPLLTISVPIGLQMGENPGRILVQGNGRGIRNSDSPLIDTNEALRVPTNQTLALVGGDVTFEGGTLKTAGGRIEVGSVAGVATVSLNPTEKGFALGYEGITNFADIQLLRSTTIDATGLSGGDIQIRGRQIKLQDGSQIETTSLETSPGGKLTVTASELVQLSGTAADNPQDNRRHPTSLATDNRRRGDIPGELTINTPRLIIRNGGRVSANSSGSGVGGNIIVNAADSVELTGTFTGPGGVRSSGLSVQTRGRGNAGKLTVNTKNLTIQDGAELSASTFGVGNGGEVEVNALDAVEVIGANGQLPSRVVAEVGSNAREVNRNGESVLPTGRGGNLKINTAHLSVTNGATVTVSSRSEAANAQGAGTLDITAQTIRLDNAGEISAASFSGQGGDMRLQVQELLLLRRNSQISTTAGIAQAGGDGGNITITAPFIVAVPNENSDITANAFTGRGGRVQISARNIFGIEPRSRQELQQLLGTNQARDLDPSQLPSNEITAISQDNPFLSGLVTVNTLDLDPSQGIIELPAEIVDVAGLINQNLCVAATQGSEFIVTGRGGLPLSPNENLSPDATWEDWRMTQPQSLSENTAITDHKQPHQQNHEALKIIEAQGWVKSADGSVILTDEPVAVAPKGTLFNSPICHGLS